MLLVVRTKSRLSLIVAALRLVLLWFSETTAEDLASVIAAAVVDNVVDLPAARVQFLQHAAGRSSTSTADWQVRGHLRIISALHCVCARAYIACVCCYHSCT